MIGLRWALCIKYKPARQLHRAQPLPFFGRTRGCPPEAHLFHLQPREEEAAGQRGGTPVGRWPKTPNPAHTRHTPAALRPPTPRPPGTAPWAPAAASFCGRALRTQNASWASVFLRNLPRILQRLRVEQMPKMRRVEAPSSASHRNGTGRCAPRLARPLRPEPRARLRRPQHLLAPGAKKPLPSAVLLEPSEQSLALQLEIQAAT